MSENRWYPEFKNGDYTGGIVNDHLGIYQKEKDYRSALVICEERNTAISETETLRQQLATAQAKANEYIRDNAGLEAKLNNTQIELAAAQARITEIEVFAEYRRNEEAALRNRVDDLEKENAQLKALLDTIHDMSNTQYLNTDQLYHNVDSIHRQTKAYSTDTPARETEAQSVKAIKARLAKISREAGLRLYGDTPDREPDVNRCPNCGEIFGEPTEDGLLECSKCGNQYEAQSITGGA